MHFDPVPYALLGIGALVVVGIGVGTYLELQAEARERVAFMGECPKQRPIIECELMWRTYAAATTARRSADLAAINAGVAAGVSAANAR